MADLGSIGILEDDGEVFVAKFVSGTVMDDAGSPAQRRVIAVTNAGWYTGKTELVNHGYSDPTTGAFTLGCGFNSSVAVIAFDDDAGTSYNALVFDKVVPT